MSSRLRPTLASHPVESLEDRVLLANWVGDIPNGTVWPAGQVQVITGNVHIPTGSTLTIQQGAVVKFNSFAYSFVVDGTMNAQGAVGSPVIFTEIRDDAGGDTNGNGGATVPANGNWSRIEFTSNSTGSVLDRVEIRYGGYNSPGELFVNGGQLTLTNSVVRNSSSAGIRIQTSNPTLTNNTYQNNSGGAVSMDLASNPAISGVTVTNNAVNGLVLDSGTLVGNRTWNDPDIVYWFSNDITVAQGSTLTITAGQVIKRPYFGDLLVNGSLIANGTAPAPIVFTEQRDDTAGGDTNNAIANPAGGNAGVIRFANTSTANVLDHVEVRYAGYDSVAAVVVDAAPLTFTNGAIRSSSSYGLRVQASNPTVTGNTFSGNALGAINMDLASNPAVSGNTLTGNGVNGLVLDSGTLTVNGVWNDPDIVYWFSSDITVPQGLSLTISAGQIIKRPYFGDLFVNGSLIANGTTPAPIVFTEHRDDTAGGDTNNSVANPASGNTGVIKFSSTSLANVLDHVEVRYAGYDSVAAVVADGAPLTFTNGVIRNSSAAGLRIQSSNSTITGNTFSENSLGALSMDLGSNPAISGNTLTNNGVNGLVLDAGSLPVNGVWNDPDIVYWFSGDITVPQGKSLTIAAGQVIKRPYFGDLFINGSLIGNGTTVAPIVFTEHRDDTAGGDTNNSATNPQGGNTGVIRFSNTSTANVLDHVEIRYAGYDSVAAVVVDAAPLTFTNGAIRNTSTNGMRIQSSNAIVTGNTFSDNAGAGLTMDLASNPTVSGNTLTGNIVNGLTLDGGTLTVNGVWDDSDIVYWLTNDITIPQDKTLTIAPGMIIKRNYFVDLVVQGSLTATGTIAAPIILTEYRDDVGGDTNNNGAATVPASSNAGVILFSSTSTGNVMDYVELRYGGYDSSTSLLVDGAPLSFTNGVVRNSSGHGIQARNNAILDIQNSIIVNNGNAGLRVENGAHAIGVNNTIDGNYRGVSVDGGGTVVGLTNNLITNNTRAGIANGNRGFVTASFNDVFNPGAFEGNYNGTPNGTGTNGNISINPVYVDRSALSFRLQATSPVIDAATSVGAPIDDRDFNFRIDTLSVPNTGAGAKPFFDMGAYEFGGLPRALKHSPQGDVAGFVSRVLLTFRGEMDTASFNPATDIASFTGPNGALTVTAFEWRNPYQLELSFAEQRSTGDYQLVLNPGILDDVGNALDVDADGTRNEIPDDRYLADWTIVPPRVRNHTPDDYVGGTVDHLDITFDRPMDQFSFSLEDDVVSFVGPDGEIPLTGFSWVDARTLRVTFAALPTLGQYELVLGSGIKDLGGNELDQSGNGIAGENPVDRYSATFTLANVIRVSGDITTDTTWSGLVVVEDDVTVKAGATLTVSPGTIVKIADMSIILVQSGGTLLSNGTTAQPIRFTSIHDDTIGGDTDDNDQLVGPQPGDWISIYIEGGTATFESTHIRYGGGSLTGVWSQSGMFRTTGNATLTISRSTLTDAFFDGVLTQGGNTTISNCVIAGTDRGVVSWLSSAHVQVMNSTIVDNRIGLLGHGGTLNVVNSIVSNNLQFGIDNDIDPDPTVSYTDIFTPGGTNTRGFANPIGSNGNKSVEPQFKDLDRRDYQLQYQSPVIDAANGAGASATDLIGSPRYDDPRTANTGTAGAGGVFVDMGALEFVETAASNIDMVVTAVAGPSTATVGDVVTIQWTVMNNGTEALTGPWHDRISLLRNPANPNDEIIAAEVLIGEGLTLGPGQKFNASVEVQVPGVLAGLHYWQVTTNPLRDIFEGINSVNNSTLSTTQVDIALDALIVDGATISDNFIGTGDARWFKVVPQAGQDVRIALDAAATNGDIELFVAQGYIPTPNEYDRAQTQNDSADPSLVIPGTAAQPYYVLARARTLPNGPTTFTIRATEVDFGVTAVSPSTVGNKGSVTLKIEGGRLAEDTLFELVDPSNQATSASSVFRVDSSTVYATFNLQGKPVGTYDVRLGGVGSPAVLLDSVTVIEGLPGAADVNLVTPRAIRVDRLGTILVEYANNGDTDIIAPMIRLTVNAGSLISDSGEQVQNFTFLGVASSGPAGVLAPGARGSFSIKYRAPVSAGVTSVQIAAVSDASEPVDWNGVRDSMRPLTTTTDAWSAIFGNFLANMGTTVGTVNARLAATATYLSQLGVYTGDIARLTNFELSKAGLNLISDRYRLGVFGRGRLGDWEMKATTDATDGSVSIVDVDGYRRFEFNTRTQTYVAAPGTTGSLVRLGSVFELLMPSGEKFVFRPDGQLDFQEFPGGKRNTYAYTSGRVTSITDVEGNVTQLEYNAQGRVSRMVDVGGVESLYGYDVAGEHLTSVTSEGLTTQFAYVTGQGAAREHAVASITFPDNSHIFFEYDAQGRVTREYRDGQTESVTFNYSPDGTITATDASGVSSTVKLDEFGEAAVSTDTTGGTTRKFYDDHGNLIRVVFASGAEKTFTYDERGNPVRSTDENGGIYETQYREEDNRMIAFTDSRGNVTRFEYDANGYVSAQVYADGSRETFVTDDEGNLQSATNRKGQTTIYTYDDKARLTNIQYSDGSFLTRAYDDHWNIVSLTDNSGQTIFDYDGDDRLTKVTYPNGRFLQYEYDTGGRRGRTTDSSGFVQTYSYDAVGRLTRLADGSNHTIATYTYDTTGKLSRQDLANGTFTTYEYDPLSGNVLHLINRNSGNTILSRFDYTYDVDNLITSMSTLDGSWTYEYDPARQLTHATFASINVAIPNQDLRYVYDAMGNRVQTIENGLTTTYTTNELNQYTQSGTANYTYDADGNLASKTDASGTWTYTYDVRKRLTGVTHGTDVWAFQYDALGNRIRTTFNGATTTYLVDPMGGTNVVAEFDHSGSVQAHYTWGVNLASRVAGNGTAAFYAFDALGSTSELTGTGGAVLNDYSYQPFGQSLAKSETVANPFQFIGGEGVMVEATGLHFMRARFYDAATGRFTQEDPLSLDVTDTNLYRYAGNSPTTALDPTGLSTKSKADRQRELRQELEREKEAWRRADALFGYPEDDAVVLNIIRLALKQTNGDVTAALGLVVKWREANNKARVDDPNFAAADHYLQMRSTNGGITTTVGPAVPPIYYGIKKFAWWGKSIWGTIRNYGSSGQDSWNAGSQPSTHQWKWAWLGMPWDYFGIENIEDLSSFDPNEIIGPAGFGEGHFITPDSIMPFTILFENKSDATAAAQQVTVTHTLPDDLDWTTFEITGIGFNNYEVEVPEGRQNYSVLTTLPNDPNPVRVTVTLNSETGLVTWLMQSEDPVTHDFPEDPFAGFLPPNDETHRGEGFVNFKIRSKVNLLTGTTLQNQADIVFDNNPVIATNVALNTIDAAGPTSSVNVLPNLVSATFQVSWSGTDDSGGSGIGTYDIYVSDNNGEYTLWQSATSNTSASYTGEAGHTYRFYSVAQDNVGHTEAAIEVADATTTVETNTAPSIPSGQAFNVAGNAANGVVIGTVTASDSNVTSPNNTKTFSIASGNATGAFAINAASGQITVANATALTALAGTVVTLQVTVTDGGAPTLSATQGVDITVASVATPPVLATPGTAPTYVGKLKTPVVVMPTITVTDVNDPASLATVVITLPFAGKKVSLDTIGLPGLSSIGSRSDSVVNGRLTITITVSQNVTNAAVQTMLRGMTFSTKGAGLKMLSRDFQVRVTDRTGLQSNVVIQNVTVRKK